MDEQLELQGLIATREEVIGLSYSVLALKRKAQCRQVNCDIIEQLERAAYILQTIDDNITELLDD